MCLIHLLGRVQLEAVGKGLQCPLGCCAQAVGLGAESSNGWRFAGDMVGLCRLEQGFPGPCSAPCRLSLHRTCLIHIS